MSSSGSGARRREAVMTYLRLAKTERRGSTSVLVRSFCPSSNPSGSIDTVLNITVGGPAAAHGPPRSRNQACLRGDHPGTVHLPPLLPAPPLAGLVAQVEGAEPERQQEHDADDHGQARHEDEDRFQPFEHLLDLSLPGRNGSAARHAAERLQLVLQEPVIWRPTPNPIRRGLSGPCGKEALK